MLTHATKPTVIHVKKSSSRSNPTNVRIENTDDLSVAQNQSRKTDNSSVKIDVKEINDPSFDNFTNCHKTISPSSIHFTPIESKNGHSTLLDTRLSSFANTNSISRFKLGSLGGDDDDEKEERRKRRRRGGFFQITSCCCCALFAAAIAAILLAALITAIIWLLMQPKVTTTTTTSTSIPQQLLLRRPLAPHQQQVHPVVLVLPVLPVPQVLPAQHQHQRRPVLQVPLVPPVPPVHPALQLQRRRQRRALPPLQDVHRVSSNYCWNTTGATVAGTSGSGAIAKATSIYIDPYDKMYLSGHNVGHIEMCLTNATSRTSTASDTDHIDYITFDKDGYMYTNDHENDRVKRFSPGSSTGTVIAGTGTSTPATLNNPVGVAVDDNLNLYIGEQGTDKVLMLPPNSTTLVTAINTGGTIKTMSALLLSSSSSNEIYISDEGGTKVFLWPFNASSARVTYTSVSSGPSTLNKPRGLKLDSLGNLYVADQENKRIVMYCVNSTMGHVVMQMGDKPVDLAFDSNMNMYTFLDSGEVVRHKLL
ncbi:hypothetical protein I4U23_011153 [Adineta vaga]|nr:hypothetical protein I4U23_011153 [Adineta vaga]